MRRLHVHATVALRPETVCEQAVGGLVNTALLNWGWKIVRRDAKRIDIVRKINPLGIDRGKIELLQRPDGETFIAVDLDCATLVRNAWIWGLALTTVNAAYMMPWLGLPAAAVLAPVIGGIGAFLSIHRARRALKARIETFLENLCYLRAF